MAVRCSPVIVGVIACACGPAGPAACARSSLAEEAYEAPVDSRAPTSVKGNAGDVTGSDGGDDDAGEPGLVARDDFSRQTETVCAVAGCSFRDKVDIERVFEDARVSAGAEQDDVLAREALAEAFGGTRFTAADALRYYELRDPPNDDIVAQLSRVLADLHAMLDAGQREAIATEIAEAGPFAVLGVPRRGGFAAGQRGGPAGAGAGEADTADGDPSDGGGARRRGSKGGKRGHQRGSGSGRPNNVGADGLRVRQRARVDGLCEALECSDGQRSQLTSMFSQRERKDFDAEIASMNLKLALLFRADEAPPEAVERQMRSLREMGDARDKMRAELLAGIHELLTPQQRATAATRMRSEDPGRALGLRPGR